jgi:anaerobic magnesium-protoporphyrin IX monomethyl ester cyclase
MLSVKVRSAYLVAKISKDINSNITIIVGADHPTIFPEEVLKNPDINYVVRGEGEITIKELISHLEDERRLPLDTIKGISYKKNGKIVHNPDRDLISDINSLPFPAIYLLNNLETYRPIDLGVILASRGCPYKCSFCGVSSIWTRRIRYRSLRNVFIEMKGLNANYGTDYFSFRDASFTLSRRRTILLCEKIIRENFRIQWECLTRADLIDEEVVTLMKKSGCTTIRIGIESGSEEILKDMNKSIDLDRVRSVAKLLNKYNFNWSAYFLFGTPRETRETISTTLKLIEEIDPPFVTIARYAPIPGTKMYNDLINAKLISPSIDWSFESNQRLQTNYVYSMSENEFEDVMRDVARYIEDRNRVNKFGVRDARLR